MRTSLVLLLFACLPASVFSQSVDWPCWRGPNHDGASTETGWNPKALEGGAKVAWQTDVGYGYSGVAIAAGRLYTMGAMKGALTMYCLDATEGKVIWQSDFKKASIPQSTPAVDGDRVYGLGGDGSLVCMRSENGQILWEKNLVIDFSALKPAYDWSTSPIVEGDLVLLEANSKALALDRSNGELAWAFDDPRQKPSGNNPDQDAHATVVVCNIGTVRYALFSTASMLHAIDVRTGTEVWSYSYESSYSYKGPGGIHDPLVSGGRVLVPDRSLLLDPAEDRRAVLWSSQTGYGSLSSPVLIGGYFYCSEWPISFYPANWNAFKYADLPLLCVEWETGRVVWKHEMGFVNVTAADGKILALELNGTLHVVQATPSGCQELSSADVLGGAEKRRTFATPPVLWNGRIYCRNSVGDLVCINVSN